MQVVNCNLTNTFIRVLKITNSCYTQYNDFIQINFIIEKYSQSVAKEFDQKENILKSTNDEPTLTEMVSALVSCKNISKTYNITTCILKMFNVCRLRAIFALFKEFE